MNLKEVYWMNKQIFYNGIIISMDDHKEYQAILVMDKKIISCGTNENILKLKTADIQIIDLKGQVVIPAFVDAHSHVASLAKSLRYVNLGEAKSIKDITNLLKPHATGNES